MAYDEEPLTDEEIEGIKESLEDIKANRVFTEDEAKKCQVLRINLFS